MSKQGAAIAGSSSRELLRRPRREDNLLRFSYFVLLILAICPCRGILGNGVKIELGLPVVVAQAPTRNLPWGIWQFPIIIQPERGRLDVIFSMSVDNAEAGSAAEYKPPAVYSSSDGGKSWRREEKRYADMPRGIPYNCRRRNGDLVYLDIPIVQDIPKKELPGPAGKANYGYGYGIIRDSLKMPKGLGRWYLMRKASDADTWQRIPATLEDPDRGIYCYDPPCKDYSVVWWGGGGTEHQQILELRDNSLLSIHYGFRLGADRKPSPNQLAYCLRSTDNGRTWKFQGTIARDDDNQTPAGYEEPWATLLPDGSLIAALRTEAAKSGPMFLVRSIDGGRGWSKPEEVYPFGVWPQLLTLENGVTVLSFGRPGNHLLFSWDGKGEKWGHLTTLLDEATRQTRTSGYASLLAMGPDRFLIVYDQFDFSNAEGEPRKTIFVRPVRVSLSARGK